MGLGVRRKGWIPSFALMAVAVAVVACGTTPAPSASPPAGTSGPSASPSSSPTASGSTDGSPVAGGIDEATGTLIAGLEEAGADVRVIGPFEGEPVGGQGLSLCVQGNLVNVYVFADAAEAQSRAAMIDPDDPSNLGTSIVTWTGNPRFWQADRLLILYLGEDLIVEAGLKAALGEPFARGTGRGAAGELTVC